MCAATIMAPVYAGASDQSPSPGTQDGEILIEEPIDRRVDLKRTLLTSGELTAGDRRQALSRDQRDALSRELREAISGLYEQRANERARNRNNQ